MTLYFVIVFGFYFLLLIALRWGWMKGIKNETSAQPQKNQFISVVVAVRNEEGNLNNLINFFSSQHYASSDFEVIFVNDHSTDNSLAILEELARGKSNFKIVSLDPDCFGKKSALTKGIALAKGNVIATTDADCVVQPNWLKRINEVFQNDEVKMAIGTVALVDKENFFSQWQAMEFASVMATTVATLGLGMPTMCNGANLAFRKNVFDDVKGYEGNAHIPSGDDEFLMRKIIGRFPHSVALLKNDDSVVLTNPQPSVNDFVQQRLRWASKWKFNSSLQAKALAVFILGVQASWIGLMIFMVTNQDRVSLVIIAGLKIITDLIFLLPAFRFFKIRFRIVPFVGLQFLYPFYVLLIGIFSQWKSYRWKGRTVT